MDNSNQEQILKIFQSLFSKEKLRKNLYLFQYLNPDMTLRIKTISQQRKVAAISKDPNLIFQCLEKCPLVKIIDQETIRILVNGDALIVRVRGLGQKQMSISEIKKLMVPLLKDIKYEIRQNKNIVGEVQTQVVEIQLQSETSAAEFIQRIKAKNAPVDWQLKEKDTYQCIRKSIKYLLKERKNQQQGNYAGSSYYTPQIYQQNYYNNYQQAPQSYVPHNYQQTKPSYSNYPIFIRKAVESSDQQPYQNDKQPQKQKEKSQRKPKIYEAKKQKNNNNDTNDANDKKNQPTITKDNSKVINFGSDDFPTL